MPTVQEIINKADKKVPNGETAVDKISILNTLQNRLYRKYKILNLFEYEILKGQYAINIGITPSKIFRVLVDGEEYPEKKVGGTSTEASRYHYYLENLLAIYPAVSVDGVLSVFAYETPTQLLNLSDKPSLEEDYHDILVYGLCKELAENVGRYDLANGFTQQYNSLEEELAEVFPFEIEVETIQSESGW